MGNKHPLFSDEEYDEIVSFRKLVDAHLAAGTIDEIYDTELGKKFLTRANEGNWQRGVKFVCTAHQNRITELKKLNKFLYLKNPLARRAYYNQRDDSIVIKFRKTKKRLIIPCGLIRRISELTPKQKSRVSVKKNGEYIRWDGVKFYVSVVDIAEGRYGDSLWMKELREKGIINNIRII